MKKLVFIINVDWFFTSHRLPIAIEAIKQGYEVHIITKITSKGAILENNGLIVHNLNFNRKGLGLYVLKEFFDIFRIIKTINPHIVHLVTIKPVLLGGLAARLAKVPAVVSAISGLGYMYSNSGMFIIIRHKIIEFFYQLAFNHSNQKIIFQNSTDKFKLNNTCKNISKKSFLIPGSGVDLSLYSEKKIENHTVIIMMAARLLKSKGVKEFIETAKIINKDKIIARFVLVGDIDLSNPESFTKKEIDHWRDENFVEIWGYKDNMHNVIPMADVVVFPSYYGEGLPKVLIEAAACGRPVITSDHPGCRDAIINNETGLLVSIKNVNEIVSAVNTLIQDPKLRIKMGKAARILAEKKFSIDQVVSRHIKIYSNLLNKER
jgi:glycosyltransferase involved in cell wall biosynthesis